jgi:hypothetical protein
MFYGLVRAIIKGASIYCREKPENKADGAQKPESRPVGMRILSTTQRSNRVSEQINRGALKASCSEYCRFILSLKPSVITLNPY